jgi:hypothetical protein
MRRFRPLALVATVLVAGSVGLNRATGDGWLEAFASFGIAIGVGILGGVAYYVALRLLERFAERS